jgi:hypothetical protein
MISKDAPSVSKALFRMIIFSHDSGTDYHIYSARCVKTFRILWANLTLLCDDQQLWFKIAPFSGIWRGVAGAVPRGLIG